MWASILWSFGLLSVQEQGASIQVSNSKRRSMIAATSDPDLVQSHKTVGTYRVIRGLLNLTSGALLSNPYI